MTANTGRRRALWLLAVLPVALALACGGGGSTREQTPTPDPDPTAPAAATPTATATATAAPAWWEEETPEPTPDIPQSRVWNVQVEAVSETEVAVTFDYHLDLAPEANQFVHLGLLPSFNLALLDAGGETIKSVSGELDPTEFGDDTVGGQATFALTTSRFADVEAVHFCIRVVTGNYDDFVGRTEIFCEPVPAERVEP